MKKLVIVIAFALVTDQSTCIAASQALSPATRDLYNILYTQPENIEALEAYLKKGANVRSKVSLGTTLHILLYGSTNAGKIALPRETLTLLLTAGADPEEPDLEGKSFLNHLLELHEQTNGHFSHDIVHVQTWIRCHKNPVDLSGLSLKDPS